MLGFETSKWLEDYDSMFKWCLKLIRFRQSWTYCPLCQVSMTFQQTLVYLFWFIACLPGSLISFKQIKNAQFTSTDANGYWTTAKVSKAIIKIHIFHHRHEQWADHMSTSVKVLMRSSENINARIQCQRKKTQARCSQEKEHSKDIRVIPWRKTTWHHQL